MIDLFGKGKEEVIEEIRERHPYIPIDVVYILAEAIERINMIQNDISELRPKVLEIARKEKRSQSDTEFLDKYAKLVDEERKYMRMISEIFWKWRKEKVDLKVDDAILVEIAESFAEVKNDGE